MLTLIFYFSLFLTGGLDGDTIQWLIFLGGVTKGTFECFCVDFVDWDGGCEAASACAWSMKYLMIQRVNFLCDYLLSLRVCDGFVHHICIDPYNWNQLKEQWYPITMTAKIRNVIRYSLISKINTAHPMIVIVNQFRYVNFLFAVFSPHFINMLTIFDCFSWFLFCVQQVTEPTLWTVDMQKTRPLSIYWPSRVPYSSIVW